MRFQHTLAAFLACALAACAGSGQFTLTSDDNSAKGLAEAFAIEKKPAPGQPMNASGKPLAFIVTAVPKKLIAFDLAAGKPAWEVEAQITSRVAVGGTLVAAREGDGKIVARSLEGGQALWEHALPGRTTFLGLAADADRVYYVIQDDSGKKRTWFLIALAGGRELWRVEAPGTLGAPAARGGLVYMPFLTQWLSILDGQTGKQIVRVRQTDEALSFVRTTSDGVYYGSKGIFVLDEKSIAGTKEGATYGQAKLPGEFVRTVYHFDHFSAVQAGYSAYDRNRVLWRADGSGGKLSFRDNLAIVFSFRFFFAFDATSGELKWVHHHPRHDLVSVEHAGDAIVYVSVEGEVGALDAKTGARLFEVKLGKRVTGASFDADGFAPKGEGEAPTTVASLAAILADKDTRFGAVKLFAAGALGAVPGDEASAALLAVILDDNTPPPVYQKAAEALVARKDKGAVPALIAALQVKHDYLTGSKPKAIEVLARALAAIGAPEAVPALAAHLGDPATPMGAIKDLADALGKSGSKDAIPPLRSFLLVYRADPSFGGDNPALPAVIDALLALGGGAERELVKYVADDERTQPGVAEYAKFALSQTAPKQ